METLTMRRMTMATILGRNVEVVVKGKVLTITIDLAAEGHPSASGKTLTIATTGGNQVISGADHSKGEVKLGVNVYRKPL